MRTWTPEEGKLARRDLDEWKTKRDSFPHGRAGCADLVECPFHRPDAFPAPFRAES